MQTTKSAKSHSTVFDAVIVLSTKKDWKNIKIPNSLWTKIFLFQKTLVIFSYGSNGPHFNDVLQTSYYGLWIKAFCWDFPV